MFGRLVAAMRRDVVLTASMILAVLSCLVTPPGPDYLTYIDFNTLIILFCLMLIVEGLKKENFLQYIAGRMLGNVRTVRGLVGTLVLLCFLGSMLITNDVALITFVPLGILMLQMAELEERVCYTVVLMTVAANLGSMFTPIGNPQNLYLFSISGWNLTSFFSITAPYTVGAAVLLVCCVILGYKQSGLYIEVGRSNSLDTGSISIYLTLFLLCILTVGKLLPHGVLLVLVAAVLFWKEKELFAGVDYSLIFTFVFFFIFVGNIKQVNGLAQWLGSMMEGRDRLLGAVSSQVISNVPAAMLLSGYSSDLRELVIGVNLGGLGTLIASMASLISYKQIANRYPEKKRHYLILFTILNVVFLIVLYLI